MKLYSQMSVVISYCQHNSSRKPGKKGVCSKLEPQGIIDDVTPGRNCILIHVISANRIEYTDNVAIVLLNWHLKINLKLTEKFWRETKASHDKICMV